jgi:hypothetical protein
MRFMRGSLPVALPVLCLALAVTVLVAPLAGPRSLASRFFPPADLADGPPPLDSFSAPAVACAILEQETQRLWRADQIARLDQVQNSPGQHGRKVAQPGSQPLMALAARVQDLALDLNSQLMGVELEDQSWDGVVDRYLSLIYQAPERNEARAWARCALDCARQCGRAAEVAGAMRHVLRSRPQLRGAAAWEATLDEWEAQPPPDVNVSRP